MSRAIDYDLVTVSERNEYYPESEVQLLVRRLVPPLSNRSLNDFRGHFAEDLLRRP
jgi:hypothetical protein